ncbi:MAG: hypothetical protein ACXABY_21720, partial [Candidatus Thorarchaeota archaeon]
NPALRILYISSTARLANKQLKFIKDILTSDVYRFYWPDMVNREESQREKWSETEISVDHPVRKLEAVRDPTIFTAGLTTGIVGLHCDIAILDDVVVYENAYTNEGRDRVITQVSLLASIQGTDSVQWVVGTRYHPDDMYGNMISMVVEMYDDEGQINFSEELYEVFERQVETIGDGTGEYLWPRQQRYDGKWFGFDQSVLAVKRAQYQDRLQFRSQYYNDPNDIENATISPDMFQYYDRNLLARDRGRWYYKGKRLNLFAAIDFAYSLGKRSDYTAIVVVGVDSYSNYYVLDIDRFKTEMISVYFDHLLNMHQKWDFRKLRAETTAAQRTIVKELKSQYIRPHGLALSIDEKSPTRHQGSKEERIEAILQPRYDNLQMWHYQGGHCQTLEDELIVQNPPHDDVKDSLAACLEISIAPSSSYIADRERGASVREDLVNKRFGGIG